MVVRINPTYETIEGWIGDGWLQVGGPSEDPVQVDRVGGKTLVNSVDGDRFLEIDGELSDREVGIAVASYWAGWRAASTRG